MQHHAGNIGGCPETRVPDHIHIGEPRCAERITDACAARAFNVRQNLQPFGQLETRVERQHARGCVLPFRTKAVCSRVFSPELPVLLPDQIHLSRKPEPVPQRRGYLWFRYLGRARQLREKQKYD